MSTSVFIYLTQILLIFQILVQDPAFSMKRSFIIPVLIDIIF